MQDKYKKFKRRYKENKDKLDEAEKATNELGNEMDDTAKQTNIFGEFLKVNLVSDMIKLGLSSIVNGIKNIANAIFICP